MKFELHPNLQKKAFVAKLPLCDVLMEDESAYPWFFLVPRRAGVSRIMDLNSDDQLLLLKELDLLQKVVWDEFKPTQINVAAIGNKTPQLHIHVIARYADDPAWPGTVWDHPVKTPYDPLKKSQILERVSHGVKRIGKNYPVL